MMNFHRRATLGDVRSDLSALHRTLSTVIRAEENALSLLPEPLQFGSLGEQFDARVQAMKNAAISMKDALLDLDEAVSLANASPEVA